MHVLCVNYAYDRSLTTPDALLDRYETLTGWADGLVAAGARVSVAQRFGADAEATRGGVLYRFVRDPTGKPGSLLDWPRRMHRAIVTFKPDVVHVNGLQFARQAWRLKRETGGAPVLLQDHANAPPAHPLNRWTLRAALRRLDAVSFVAREQAQPWQEGGFLRADQPVFEIMEGSSRFCLQPRAAARARTGLSGDPLCLWVGRLNANKDPLTVLRGFAKALPALQDARLAMAYGEDDLLPAVQAWLTDNPTAAARVTLLGRQPHAALEPLYNSADLFLLGSHHEGSGYAALEALSCGVVPLITDIPSFRVLCGGGQIGGLWPAGDSDTLAATLMDWNTRLQPDTPQRVRAFFEERFSWEAIGRQAFAAYTRLLEEASR